MVETADGALLAAWFGGTHEGHPDVAIWLARFDGQRWGAPVKVADVAGVSLWNPVLFRDISDTVWLFYKVGPDVPSWTGVYISSADGGRTWSKPSILPSGLLGPVKNKPITLSNHDILCGTSHESWQTWTCWVEIISENQAWSRHGPISVSGFDAQASVLGSGGGPVSAVWDTEMDRLAMPQGLYGVIQPSVWEYAPGRVKMLMRATQEVGFVCCANSDDYGRTWTAAFPTMIPNPNCGLDALRLEDGRIVLACNPTHKGRTPLALLMSEDNGMTWPWRLDLEIGPGEYSYPAIIQAGGHIHVVYTYNRERIQHVTLEPDVMLTGWFEETPDA